MRITLFEIGLSARSQLAEAVTNQDGRTDEPLIAGGPLRTGTYELLFHVGAYYAATGTNPGYLTVVPVRFSVAEPESHYHVPLIVTPFSHTTYRGG
jgi:hydroxyisourate hydrolase